MAMLTKVRSTTRRQDPRSSRRELPDPVPLDLDQGANVPVRHVAHNHVRPARGAIGDPHENRHLVLLTAPAHGECSGLFGATEFDSACDN